MNLVQLVETVGYQIGKERSKSSKQAMVRLRVAAAGKDLDAFVELLKEFNEQYACCERAVVYEAVASRKDKLALDFLLSHAVPDNTPRVRQALYRTLPEFGAEGLIGFRALWDAHFDHKEYFGTDEEDTFVKAALQCGDEAIPFVAEILSSSPAIFMRQSFSIYPQDLLEERGTAFAPALLALLGKPRMRRRARTSDHSRVLLRMCGMPAVELLCGELETGDDPRIRRAAEVLSQFELEAEKGRAIPALSVLLEKLYKARTEARQSDSLPAPAPIIEEAEKPKQAKPRGFLARLKGLFRRKKTTGETVPVPDSASTKQSEEPLELEILESLWHLAAANGRRSCLEGMRQDPSVETRAYLAATTAPLAVKLLNDPIPGKYRQKFVESARCLLTEIAILESGDSLVAIHQEMMKSPHAWVRAQGVASFHCVLSGLAERRSKHEKTDDSAIRISQMLDSTDRSEEARKLANSNYLAYRRLLAKLPKLLQDDDDEVVLSVVRTFAEFPQSAEREAAQLVSLLQRFENRTDYIGMSLLEKLLEVLSKCRRDQSEAVPVAIRLLERPCEKHGLSHWQVVEFLGSIKNPGADIRDAMLAFWKREDLRSGERDAAAKVLGEIDPSGEWMDSPVEEAAT